eukprot:scaffold42250_cov44-Attheya_sp.AAC.1
MADEIGVSILLNENDIQGSGVAECLIDLSRKTQQYGQTKVDNPASISKDLAAEVAMKAFLLKTFFAPPGTPLARPSQGQVGFVRGAERIQSSPGGRAQYAVTPITAKHNLRHIQTKAKHGGREIVLDAMSTESYPPWDHESKLYLWFEDLNWTPTAADRFVLRGAKSDNTMIWPFGNDVSMGNKISSYTQGVTGEDASFELVRKSGFKLEAGQKIGIAVFSEHPPTKVTASYDPEHPSNYSAETLKEVFGEAKQVNIYTGEIILVGDNHIEHNINSFTGCSGAVIFLLDKEQPSSVDKDLDIGKAIAVHVGSHPSIRTRNIGFRLVTG